MLKFIRYAALAVIAAFAASCGAGGNKTATSDSHSADSTPHRVQVPVFDADTAYAYTRWQVELGPRTPGSEAQRKCADWMAKNLNKWCDTVYRQETTVKGGDGKMLPCINVIGVIHPNATHRILMLTHWDSRPWADMDTKDQDKPIDAADDGASGVAILTELAKVLKTQNCPSTVGVDILFTDVEDYGRSEWGESSYCLGTQYWAAHPHVPGYKAAFGILLDMTGAKNAQFPMEGVSARFASDIQEKVWSAAGRAGYSSYFLFTPGADITDDHVPVNTMTGIKTIDIINLTSDPEKPFAAHWHTHADNMQVIDRNTLKAVGQTLLQVVYEEGATP